jgi:hypothetical protein
MDDHGLGNPLLDSPLQNQTGEAGGAGKGRQSAHGRRCTYFGCKAQWLGIPPRCVVQALWGYGFREELGLHQDGLRLGRNRWHGNWFRDLGFSFAPRLALQEEIERILVLLLQICFTVRGGAELSIVQLAQSVDFFPAVKAIHSVSSIGKLAPGR